MRMTRGDRMALVATLLAALKKLNDQGGIDGRKINFSYSPPKTLEQVRRLVEQDEVAFEFQTIAGGNRKRV